MSKEEELQRFKIELEKQIQKGNEGNIKYCRLNIERLEKEIAAQKYDRPAPNEHPDTIP